MGVATTRRDFLRASAAAAVWPDLNGDAPRVAVTANDESFWSGVSSAFDLDRTAVYLNAAGVAPAAARTMDSLLLDTAFRNRLPARHLWTVLEPRVEGVRTRLAGELGCTPEEVALTRNATEALQIVQLGLPLQPGDEVVTTDHDFFRMINTWEQRAVRDGIVFRRAAMPDLPATENALMDALFSVVTPRTRAILFCHVTNVNGQIFPVQRICAEARARGIVSIVDGAQAFGHLAFRVADLGCDCYAGSLHKYVLAPLGTGFLHIRKSLIPDVWPLTPASASRHDNVRKFEDVGTHPAAVHNAVGEALRYRAGIGQDAITDRLTFLTRHWTTRVAGRDGVVLFNRLHPRHTRGIATVGISGMEPRTLVDELWTKFKIVTRPVSVGTIRGVRVSPHIYNTLDEVDYFAEALLSLTA